jgi:hypothetical protein
MKRARAVGLLSLVSASLLFMAVCVPWFDIPVLGWQVPAPAFNRAGLACIALACVLLIRSIGGTIFRWGVRAGLLPSIYYWWHSLAEVKAWGAEYLATAQLKLSPVNQMLARMGTETITLYNAPEWRALEPTHGWYGAGGVLFFVLLLTAFDGTVKRHCLSCKAQTRENDSFCGGCGKALDSVPKCRNCGAGTESEDDFCRRCGQAQEES